MENFFGKVFSRIAITARLRELSRSDPGALDTMGWMKRGSRELIGVALFLVLAFGVVGVSYLWWVPDQDKARARELLLGFVGLAVALIVLGIVSMATLMLRDWIWKWLGWTNRREDRGFEVIQSDDTREN
jgi:hypothetical protein